jgi:hypothetical protein
MTDMCIMDNLTGEVQKLEQQIIELQEITACTLPLELNECSFTLNNSAFAFDYEKWLPELLGQEITTITDFLEVQDEMELIIHMAALAPELNLWQPKIPIKLKGGDYIEQSRKIRNSRNKQFNRNRRTI